MKNILTLTLIFFSFQCYSQTLEQLQLRLQIVENSTMTLPQFNLAMDTIAIKRDIFLKKDLQDWGNSGLRILRGENAVVQAINVNQLVALQNQITGLLTEIEALKLRITNLKVTIQ